MQSWTEAWKPKETPSGLDSVRERAQKQSVLRFRANDEGELQPQAPRPLRSLKDIGIHIEEARRQQEMQQEEEPCWISRLWDKFQTAIGNR